MKIFNLFLILITFFGTTNLEAQFKSGEIIGGASLGLIPQGTGDSPFLPLA